MLLCNNAVLKNKRVEKLTVIPEAEKNPQNIRMEKEEASPQ